MHITHLFRMTAPRASVDILKLNPKLREIRWFAEVLIAMWRCPGACLTGGDAGNRNSRTPRSRPLPSPSHQPVPNMNLWSCANSHRLICPPSSSSPFSTNRCCFTMSPALSTVVFVGEEAAASTLPQCDDAINTCARLKSLKLNLHPSLTCKFPHSELLLLAVQLWWLIHTSPLPCLGHYFEPKPTIDRPPVIHQNYQGAFFC